MTAPVLAATAWPTNAHLIEACHQLGYLNDDDHVLDPTYGKGTWWKRWRPNKLVASDLAPGLGDETNDFRYLYWNDDTFDAIAFDPPYKLNGTPTPAVDTRYGVHVVAGWKDRHRLIRDGITELARVLRPGGILLLKCQDQVCGGKVRWQSHEFTRHAQILGLELLDELHMLAYRPQPEGRRQVHARRNYSTMLVLKGPSS